MYYKPEIKTLDIGEATVDCIIFGEGKKPFVMLPGLSLNRITGSAQAIASAYRRFGEDFTVYVFERRNEIETGYSIEDMAADTAKAMEKLDIKDAYVFGVSQGGMAAICLAADYPHLVKKLIPASTSAKESENSRRIFVDWIGCALKGQCKSLVESFTDCLYSDEFIKKYKPLLVKMYENISSDELIRFCILASACYSLDISQKLEKIKCPVLVIGSEKDKVFSVEDFNFIREKTGGEIFIYDGYGHAVYDEAPDYKDRIADFFT